MDAAALATNIVLAVITAVYAGLTFWMALSTKRAARASEIAAKAAQESTEAAKDSAEAAKQAAQANRESAAAALASLEVNFELDLYDARENSLVFSLTNTGRSAVFIEEFQLSHLFLGRPTESGVTVGTLPLFEPPLPDPEQAERLVHPRHSITYYVNVGHEDVGGQRVSALGKVFYSVDRTRRDGHSFQVTYASPE